MIFQWSVYESRNISIPQNPDNSNIFLLAVFAFVAEFSWVSLLLDKYI